MTDLTNWHQQAMRNLRLIHPYPYSSPIMGD